MRIPLIAATLLAAVPPATAAPAAERRFTAAGFDAVALSGSDRMVVTAGPAVSIVATGDPDAIAALRIEARGGTLHVDRLPGSYRDRGATVTVTVPRLSKVTLDGSGSIRVRGAAGPRFVAEDHGSADIVIEDLRAAETRLSLQGSGSIVAAGSSAQLWIDASGSGSVDTTRLVVRDIDVTATGSSSIRARAAGRAAIDSAGSGSVSVDGTADCRVSKSGSGAVRCRPAA
jgi:hypothetical protein